MIYLLKSERVLKKVDCISIFHTPYTSPCLTYAISDTDKIVCHVVSQALGRQKSAIELAIASLRGLAR